MRIIALRLETLALLLVAIGMIPLIALGGVCGLIFAIADWQTDMLVVWKDSILRRESEVAR